MVLFSGINEMIGMLMIPKTLAYVWTVLIGYSVYMGGHDRNLKEI